MKPVTLILPGIFTCLILGFFIYWIKSARPFRRGERSFELRQLGRYPLEKADFLPVIAITVIYAAIAFSLLGATNAPHSPLRFEKAEDTVTIDMGEVKSVSALRYYSGLHDGWYSIAFSKDGTEWTSTEYFQQKYSELFKWLDTELARDVYSARFIRLGAWNAPLEMNELALYDESGQLLKTDAFSFDSPSVGALFDEQELVSEQTCQNGMYFDEIYHGRTALEHIRGYKPYEISHPPLGKIIISIGIRLFGMVPFGWRFMGTLFGVLMLPLLYIFIKNLFGKTSVAACGTLLFAFDFMHFVQTRIATIDTYGVFFILLMYFFMYRYVSCGYEAPFRKTALPLLLSGLFFGIGAACKWTVLYGAPGLLAIYVIYQVQRGLYYKARGRGAEFRRYLLKTLLFSVLSFIVIPCAVYYVSYIPYGIANGQSVSGGMLWSGKYAKTVWDNQVFMLTYHSGVTEPHPYASRWYTWLLDVRPILYYLKYLSDSVKSAFGAFGNPMLWWGGLLALIALLIETIRRRSGRALFILIGYFSCLLPWVFIARPVFVYHYFPCTLFLTLALCYIFNSLIERGGKKGKAAVTLFTALALLLFVLFYPVLTGIPFSISYTNTCLRWFYYTWPF